MTTPEYELKQVEEGDVDKVMELLRRTFYIDEPLNQAVGLCVDAICVELDEYCLHTLKNDSLSFIAVDKSGNVVGALVNDVVPLKQDENGNDYLSMAQRCTNPKFQRILYVLARREEGSKIWEKFPDEHQLVDVKVAATDPKWRKKGIMNALLKMTEIESKKRGHKLLRMDTSSAYSAMSAERLGFTCIYSAPYTEIKMDGRPLIVPEHPHTHDSVYVKNLQ